MRITNRPRLADALLSNSLQKLVSQSMKDNELRMRALTDELAAQRELISSLQSSLQNSHMEAMEYVDKTLHIASMHYDLYGQRSSRPYYPLNDGWALTTLDSGQFFFVNTVDRNITPWIILGGHWERNVERVMLDFAQPGMTVIDIGAHFGYYTVKLGSKVGKTGRLLCFEPNPEVNAVCEENIKINGLVHVTLYKHALGKAEAVATLTRSKSNMASANLLGEQEADFSTEVRVRRIDDVVGQAFAVDLIKLDAEGYERFILEGAAGLIGRSPDCAIMIELGLERWERTCSLNDLVPACGGNKDVYAVHDDGTLQLMSVDLIRAFLLRCNFHENYFFIGKREKIESRIGHLIRR